jgi:hypothetical protein
MGKILIKRIQTQLSSYFLTITAITKLETRCLKEMFLGILKSRSVFVKRIAASLREPLNLKDVYKALSSQYLKEDYAAKVTAAHLENVN